MKTLTISETEYNNASEEKRQGFNPQRQYYNTHTGQWLACKHEFDGTISKIRWVYEKVIYSGVELISQKRSKHAPAGYDLEHDKEHKHGEIAMVAAVLALHHTDARVIEPDEQWGSNYDPWGLKKKYIKDTIGMLSEAGALLAAEIDRLQLHNNHEN